MNKRVKIHELGLIDYKEAWTYQETLFDAIVAQKLSNRDSDIQTPTDNHLIFCQHPHVFTLGKTGKQENLLLQDKELSDKNAEFYKINRGGDITYHGPGQLVVYPILDLENFFTDIHRFMRTMEEVIIKTLRDFGIEAERVQGLTGVWLKANPKRFLGERKICAMGVKASRWVTMHGLALNANTDLEYFGYIVPCGIDDKAVTSMEIELGEKVSMEQLISNMKKHFAAEFEMEWT